MKNYIDPFYEPNKDLFWDNGKQNPYKGNVLTEIQKNATILIRKQPLTEFQNVTIRKAIENGGFVFSEGDVLLQIKSDDLGFKILLENIGVHFGFIF